MLAFLGKWLKAFKTLPPLELTELAPEELFMPQPEAPGAAGSAIPDIPRGEILQRMWGKGFSTPGTNEFYLNLTRPLQLNAQKNLLDLNAGLGGAARLIAEEFKTYVTGFERDAALAAEGMKISTDSGQGKHATVTAYDPAHFDYKTHADVVMACDFFYSLGNKNLMLEKIASLLKPHGHLVMTDFVCDGDLKNPAIAEWMQKEPYGAHPVSHDVMVKLLAKHGLDLRVNEDVTQNYMREALLGLMRLAKWLEGKKLSRGTRREIGQIVEVLALRLTALKAGIKNMRYAAIKKD